MQIMYVTSVYVLNFAVSGKLNMLPWSRICIMTSFVCTMIVFNK